MALQHGWFTIARKSDGFWYCGKVVRPGFRSGRPLTFQFSISHADAIVLPNLSAARQILSKLKAKYPKDSFILYWEPKDRSVPPTIHRESPVKNV